MGLVELVRQEHIVMARRAFGLGFALLVLTASGGHTGDDLPWPHSGPMPDDPVKVRPLRYEAIGAGNKSYRPIEPMPWGDVNTRVAPPGSLPGAPPKKNGAGSGSGSGAGAAPARKPSP
jgi:hypothetical protein